MLTVTSKDATYAQTRTHNTYVRTVTRWHAIDADVRLNMSSRESYVIDHDACDSDVGPACTGSASGW